MRDRARWFMLSSPVVLGFFARRAQAQATLDTLAGQLNDVALLGVCVLALLVILILIGSAIYGRQR